MKDLRADIKQALKRIRIPVLGGVIQAYFAWRYRQTERTKYRRWLSHGKLEPPPPYYKQQVVRSMAARSGNRVFVETGTFEGQMVEAVRQDFASIYTIELDARLGAEAADRLRRYKHITVLIGDSGELLPQVLEALKEPAVFWLDAHYSGGPTARGSTDTPIAHELEAIARHDLHREHAILIDDAREFHGGAYPQITRLQEWAQANGYTSFLVEDDIIRIFNSGERP